MAYDNPRPEESEFNISEAKLVQQFEIVMEDFLSSAANDPRFKDLSPAQILDAITKSVQKAEFRAGATMLIAAQRNN